MQILPTKLSDAGKAAQSANPGNAASGNPFANFLSQANARDAIDSNGNGQSTPSTTQGSAPAGTPTAGQTANSPSPTNQTNNTSDADHSKEDQASQTATDPAAQLMAFVASLQHSLQPTPQPVPTAGKPDESPSLQVDQGKNAVNSLTGLDRTALAAQARKHDANLPIDQSGDSTTPVQDAGKDGGFTKDFSELSSTPIKGQANDITPVITTETNVKTLAHTEDVIAQTSTSAALSALAASQHVARAQAPAEANSTNQRLEPVVGSSQWNEALGDHVVWMVGNSQQTATLTLNPPDLGPLQVVLSVNNSHASANFTAQQPEVRQAIEAALPRLRDMMNEAGIQLGQTTVGSGTQQQLPREQQSSSAATSRSILSEDQEVTSVSTVATRVQRGNGMVDTFV